jgi:hypothetical protein
VSRRVFRHDRAEIRAVLETDGRDEALKRWPKHAVDPIARVLGLTEKYRPSNIWNPAWAPLLGTKPDSELAAELGLPPVTIRVQRVHLGIPTVDAKARRVERQARLASLTDEELAHSRIDALAAKIGVGFMDVQIERKRREITQITKLGKRRKPTVGRHDSASNMRRVAVFAIKGAYPDATLTQIGEAVGCTRERVRQLLYVLEASDEATAS